MNGAAPLGPEDPRKLGPYTILSRIGGGGMGTVYLGQALSRRLVAVKVIRRDRADDPALGARFRREVRAASGVAGFCTARVLDADLDAERPYYVTEYVPGPTVQEAVEEGGPLSGPRLEALAIGVAEALEAIHAAGVVHRDLKPSNVLLSPAGPKVIDFGIARPVDATTLTQTGKVIGSVNWLAPEQLRGSRASEASDVFAWGGLVTFAGTGHPPFGRGPVGTIAHRILHEEPDLQGLYGRLLEAVLGALHKDPQRRPTARALLVRLLGGVDQDPVTAATEVVQRTWMMPRVPPAPATPAADWGSGGLESGAWARAPGSEARPSGGPPVEPATVPVAPARSSQDQTPRLASAAQTARPGPARPPSEWDAGGDEVAEERHGEAEERGRAAPRTYPRGTVLADLLPGGLLRDLAVVAGFAAASFASLGVDDPVSSVRITTPALVTLAGAALLGRNRAASGFVLGAVGFHTLGQSALPGLRTTLGYLVLLMAIGLVGTLAAFGRRHKTVSAIAALVLGFVLLQSALAAVGWDTFHLPRPPDLNPLHLF
ncbi:MAG TPA: serine/threonine-protein kinase [Actinomycetes bacterium]|nr:serine/threonine-protein kinase [Actinomycetes bacterium]